MQKSLVPLTITAAMSISTAQADNSNPAKTLVQTNKALIAEVCNNPVLKAYMKHPEDICEISTDNGKTWMLLTAALAASLLGAGYSQRKKIQPYIVRFLDSKKKDRKDPPVIDSVLPPAEFSPIFSVAETRTGLGAKIKKIFARKPKSSDSSWTKTVAIPPDEVATVIREEHEKNIQALKDTFDAGFSDSSQDTIKQLYYRLEEIRGDMTYSQEHRKQVLVWRQELDGKLRELSGFLETADDANAAAILDVCSTNYRNIMDGVGTKNSMATFDQYVMQVLANEQCSEASKTLVCQWGAEIHHAGEPIEETRKLAQFEFTHSGNKELARGVSSGGAKKNGIEYMQDYVSVSKADSTTTMVVLDGVGSGTGPTEEYVAEVGGILRDTSLADLIAQDGSCLTSNRFTEVATTVGRASIIDNTMYFEKIGDIGIVIFDQEGRMRYQNIGGGFIPTDWFDDDGVVDPTIPGDAQDIIRSIETYYGGPVEKTPTGPLSKREFMKTYGRYTKQTPAGDNIQDQASADIERKMLGLLHNDTVLIATDGVFDNLSLQTLSDLIGQKISALDSVDRVFEALDNMLSSGKGDFGDVKRDNIGLSVYRHVMSPLDTVEPQQVAEDEWSPAELEWILLDTDMLPLGDTELPKLTDAGGVPSGPYASLAKLHDMDGITVAGSDSTTPMNPATVSSPEVIKTPWIDQSFRDYVITKKAVSLTGIMTDYNLLKEDALIILSHMQEALLIGPKKGNGQYDVLSQFGAEM